MAIKRYYLIDSIRGITLISMLLYHAMWDLVYLFGANVGWFADTAGHIWQRSICISFILISGFCFSLGSHKLKRGLTVLAASAVITLATVLFMRNSIIIFGILSFIGSAMLIMLPLERLLRRVNCYVGFFLSVLLFIIFESVTLGYINLFFVKLYLPKWLFANTFTAFLGFPHPMFVSYDYFPIFPWIFLYIAGYYLFHIFSRLGLMRLLHRPRIQPIEFIGRHTLIIYLVHQPLIYGLLYIIFMFL